MKNIDINKQSLLLNTLYETFKEFNPSISAKVFFYDLVYLSDNEDNVGKPHDPYSKKNKLRDDIDKVKFNNMPYVYRYMKGSGTRQPTAIRDDLVKAFINNNILLSKQHNKLFQNTPKAVFLKNLVSIPELSELYEELLPIQYTDHFWFTAVCYLFTFKILPDIWGNLFFYNIFIIGEGLKEHIKDIPTYKDDEVLNSIEEKIKNKLTNISSVSYKDVNKMVNHSLSFGLQSNIAKRELFASYKSGKDMGALLNYEVANMLFFSATYDNYLQANELYQKSLLGGHSIASFDIAFSILQYNFTREEFPNIIIKNSKDSSISYKGHTFKTDKDYFYKMSIALIYIEFAIKRNHPIGYNTIGNYITDIENHLKDNPEQLSDSIIQRVIKKIKKILKSTQPVSSVSDFSNLKKIAYTRGSSPEKSNVNSTMNLAIMNIEELIESVETDYPELTPSIITDLKNKINAIITQLTKTQEKFLPEGCLTLAQLYLNQYKKGNFLPENIFLAVFDNDILQNKSKAIESLWLGCQYPIGTAKRAECEELYNQLIKE